MYLLHSQTLISVATMLNYIFITLLVPVVAAGSSEENLLPGTPNEHPVCKLCSNGSLPKVSEVTLKVSEVAPKVSEVASLRGSSEGLQGSWSPR